MAGVCQPLANFAGSETGSCPCSSAVVTPWDPGISCRIGGGDEAIWAPDSRELFYREYTGRQYLVSVSAQTHPTFSRGEGAPTPSA